MPHSVQVCFLSNCKAIKIARQYATKRLVRACYVRSLVHCVQFYFVCGVERIAEVQKTQLYNVLCLVTLEEMRIDWLSMMAKVEKQYIFLVICEMQFTFCVDMHVLHLEQKMFQ